MAIATEIGRLQGAKQDLISRLRAKGVSVPQNATLEEITPLVDNIQSAEDLDSALTAQEAKIAELSALLDTKAAGGGVETCTLTINNRSNVTISSFVYLTEPGYYETVEGVGAYGIYTYTVLCGSLIYVMYSGNVNIATDNVEHITGYPVYGVLYMVTAGSGETATITVTLGGTSPA